MEITQRLKKTALFNGLSDDILHYFADNSRQVEYNKGQDVFSMGDPADVFFFIIKGWIKLYRITREGEEAIINVFAPGETFAEAAVFGPMQSYPVNGQAVEPTVLLEIPRRLFIDKIKEDSNFALQILGSISARQHYLIQQIEQISVKSAPQRIGTFLLRQSPPNGQSHLEIELPYDKSLIARRLNIQPETFSRALVKLNPYGVTMKGRHVIIEDAETLREFCDIEDRDQPC